MKSSANVWIVAGAGWAAREVVPCLRDLGHEAPLILDSVGEAVQVVTGGAGQAHGVDGAGPDLVIIDVDRICEAGEAAALAALVRGLEAPAVYVASRSEALALPWLTEDRRRGDLVCLREPGELALAIPLALYRRRRARIPHRDGKAAARPGTGDTLTERAHAAYVLRRNEERHASIFHMAAVPLWEDDVSRLLEALDDLRARGVTSLRQHFEDHPEQVFELASKSRIIAANAAALALFGAGSQEELSRSLGQLFIPDSLPGLREMILALAEGKSHYEGENVLCTLQGRRFIGLFRVTFLGLGARPGQRPERMLLSCLDITERKRAEEQIRRLNADLRRRAAELRAANAELESFSYSVSHDLRAPLRAMNGFSQALIEDYGSVLDEEGRSYLDRIHQASLRMAQLIDALLDLSRMSRSAMHIETCDMSAMAGAILRDLQKMQPERAVALVIEPGVQVHADRNLLRIVLENLLGNAWKFTSRQPRARIELGTVPHERRTAYFVRDNGAGFDMIYATKLFKPFQRLHDAKEFEGTGVGLATVKRIVHRHGGDIWADGRVGEGAIFTFTLS